MTKRWSTTASDGRTKRQASKDHRRELARQLKALEAQPPEATFDNVDDMLNWLDEDDPAPTPRGNGEGRR